VAPGPRGPARGGDGIVVGLAEARRERLDLGGVELEREPQ
jgi:hypothetical protein